MKRFKTAIFKQREEINDRMTEMFGVLKELTASRTPKREEEKSAEDNAMSGNNIVKLDGSDAVVSLSEVEKENEAKNGTKNEPVESAEKKLTQIEEEYLVKAPSS
ncbi:hypothetical protein Tco_0980544 [Tanacetum coccineum]